MTKLSKWSPEPSWRESAWTEHLNDVTVQGRRWKFIDIGSGPVVFLVHGLASSWLVWYRNMLDLSIDHRVIAVDLPGFGCSEALPAPVEIHHYADALAELLDHVGVERALAVGHSLGGLVVQRLAVRYPQKTSAVVLVSSGGGPIKFRKRAAFNGLAILSTVVSRGPRTLIVRTLRKTMSVTALRNRLIAAVVHDPSCIAPDLAAEMIVSVWSLGTADAVRAGLKGATYSDLRRLGRPTLIISGSSDRLVESTTAAYLARTIPGSVVEVWPGVGHHPMLERPREFNDRLRDFYNQNTSRSKPVGL